MTTVTDMFGTGLVDLPPCSYHREYEQGEDHYSPLRICFLGYYEETLVEAAVLYRSAPDFCGGAVVHSPQVKTYEETEWDNGAVNDYAGRIKRGYAARATNLSDPESVERRCLIDLEPWLGKDADYETIIELGYLIIAGGVLNMARGHNHSGLVLSGVYDPANDPDDTFSEVGQLCKAMTALRGSDILVHTSKVITRTWDAGDHTPVPLPWARDYSPDVPSPWPRLDTVEMKHRGAVYNYETIRIMHTPFFNPKSDNPVAWYTVVLNDGEYQEWEGYEDHYNVEQSDPCPADIPARSLGLSEKTQYLYAVARTGIWGNG